MFSFLITLFFFLTSGTESNRLSTHSSFSCSSGTEPDLEVSPKQSFHTRKVPLSHLTPHDTTEPSLSLSLVVLQMSDLCTYELYNYVETAWWTKCF